MQPSLGKMSAYKILNWRDQAAGTIDEIVTAFLELGEAIATRWIETRKGVLLLQMVPDDGASGAIYIFDRQREQCNGRGQRHRRHPATRELEDRCCHHTRCDHHHRPARNRAAQRRKPVCQFAAQRERPAADEQDNQNDDKGDDGVEPGRRNDAEHRIRVINIHQNRLRLQDPDEDATWYLPPRPDLHPMAQ